MKKPMINTTFSNRMTSRAGMSREQPVNASCVNLPQSMRRTATMALLLMVQAASADIYLVTTDADPGLPGFVSLRDAITLANGNPGPDVIEFSLPPGLWTINVLSDLPDITDPATIDALTQPGADGVPVVELTTGFAKNGLVIKAGNSIVRGLVINEFREYAIVLQNNGNNTISNNFIGTDVTGTVALGNGAGILISQSDSNTIGGSARGAGNLISGNYGSGIEIRSSSGNQVQGNLIGTRADGKSSLGNDTGVELIDSQHTLIGGRNDDTRNVIAGNTGRGVLLWKNVGSTIIQGNFIGLEIDGAYALPNGSVEGVSSAGVELTSGPVTGPHDTLIANNVISGNLGSGLFIYGLFTVRNTVQGNYIGTDASGTGTIGNQLDGVEFDHAANRNLIGGVGASEGNVIAHNRHGVNVSNNSVGNTIVGNSIFSNGGLGIELAGSPEDAFGVTANLPDPGVGPNNLQNFPETLFFQTAAAGTIIRGSLNSQPGREYHIDVYQNTAKDPSDHGEGQFYVGRTNITTDGFGNGDFALSVSAKFPGEFFAATATDALTGDTSEFSPVALAVDALSFNDGMMPPGSSFPGAGNVGRIADDGSGRNGVVHLTDVNQGGAFGVFSIPAPAGGSNLNNLHIHWRSLVGGDNGSVCGASQFNRPGADGYSMSWGADLPNPPSYGNPGEEGAGSGLIVTVDTFDNGNGEGPGLEIKWRGARVAFDNISADPGRAKDFLRKGVFVEADLTVDTAGQATFTYDGRILAAMLIDWGGIAGGGCIMFGARTGGACDNHWIDDLLIEKFASDRPVITARVIGGQLHLFFPTVAGRTYTIEGTDNVLSQGGPWWNDVTGALQGTGGTVDYQFGPMTGPRKFFRVRENP